MTEQDSKAGQWARNDAKTAATRSVDGADGVGDVVRTMVNRLDISWRGGGDDDVERIGGGRGEAEGAVEAELAALAELPSVASVAIFSKTETTTLKLNELALSCDVVVTIKAVVLDAVSEWSSDVRDFFDEATQAPKMGGSRPLAAPFLVSTPNCTSVQHDETAIHNGLMMSHEPINNQRIKCN